MSGIAGWVGWTDTAERGEEVFRRVEGVLGRHDRSRTGGHRLGTAAVVASRCGAAPRVAREEGLLAVCAGRPRWPGDPSEGGGRPLALLRRWRERGQAVLDDLGGDFALALVDADCGRALLATDRLGIHPLSWCARDGSLVFASRGDALQAHPAAEAGVDPQALFDYVYFHMVPAPDTARSGHARLMPGHCVRFEEGRASVRRYAQVEFRGDADAPAAELAAEFRAVVERGVARSVEDAAGPVAAFLSGGTDSSTVVGMLARFSGERPRAYSIGFDVDRYDEMEFARLAARRFDADHREFRVGPADVVEAIPRIAAVHAEPFGNESAVPTYLCARYAAEDGVGRLLGGDGGDELFAGNARYAKERVFRRWGRLPPALRTVLRATAFGFPLGESIWPVRKARSYIRQASVPMPHRLETWNHVERLGVARIFEPEFLARVDAGRPRALQEDTWTSAHADGDLHRQLAYDLRFTLADNDLPKVSRSCELAGVEIAYPLLDDALVDFAARLPESLLLKGGRLRWFFKWALRDFLPAEILSKRKHGFGLPFGIWLRTENALEELAHDSLRSLAGRGIVRPAFLEELLELHASEHATYYGVQIWNLMMLEQWFAAHGDDASGD